MLEVAGLMNTTKYDVAIIGGGHNGLVAACYLARAGKSVVIMERNAEFGGATRSKEVFAGFDAKLSVYSYLVSLLPQKIIDDLGLKLTLRTRKTASWTPAFQDGQFRELLVRNDDPAANREAFINLTGNEQDYLGYMQLQEMQQQIASVIWPSLTEPMITREEMQSRLSGEASKAWQALIEEPLGNVIEQLIADDLIRGMVFTDARIGLSTFPQDPTLLQNRCFLYHVIGQGTGEWKVPVGGMGTFLNQLLGVALDSRHVTFVNNTNVIHLDSTNQGCTVTYEDEGATAEIKARIVLCNASADALARMTGGQTMAKATDVEGAGFKMNLLLKRLPQLRASQCRAEEAFAGTVHIDEGYQQMIDSYQQSMAGQLPEKPPGEIYCHTLTDNSILSDELNQQGFHTITLFGLDLPYRLFADDNEQVKQQAVERYLAGTNQFLAEPIEDCLATDVHGNVCLEAMSARDLESKIHLPKGNIFHGDLTWPFAESAEEAGRWGVETGMTNVLLCGSSAKRGGAVSGIPGHNAAMKALEILS